MERKVQVIQPTIGFEENKILRVAAYCRVSTDSEDQANSFLTQVKYYADFINSREDMKLVDIYSDEGITGTSMEKREDFKRLMQDCKLGKIDRILVKSVSRFARNSLECLEAIRFLKDNGVSVLFENDNIDTDTMNSEMILYVKSAFAQSEALAGSKRVSTAYRMRMENGDFLTYHAPFGYRLKNGNLVVEPSEADIVKRIFKMFITGKGKNTIAGILNKEGVSGKKHWTANMVHYILTNEKYVGDSMVQKTYTPQVFPLRNIPNRGELDKFYIKETHEAIIENSLFDATQKTIVQKGQKKKKEPIKRVLTQKLICGQCGWAYRHKEQSGKEYWVCSHKGSSGFECDGPNLSQDKIYKAFVKMYNKLKFFENEILNDTLNYLDKIRFIMMQGNKELTEIDAEIAKISEQYNRYEKFHSKKIMDDVSYFEQTDRLKGKIENLRKRKKTLLSESSVEKEFNDLKQLKEIVDQYPEAILEFDKGLFESIVERIIVQHDGTLEFVLFGGLELKEKVEVLRKCH